MSIETETESQSRSALVLAAIFVTALASRLPFLPRAGLGTDPDAWRLLLAGQMLVDTGEYRTSRPPGHPAIELLSALLVGSPWWVFTLLTAMMSAVAVTAFADLLRTLAVAAWLPLTAGLALTPVVFRNGVTFMDYEWSFAFLMLSLAVFARGRLALAGGLFGIAAACRPPAVTMLVVIIVLLAMQRCAWRRWAAFLIPAGCVVALFFAVPLLTLGPSIVTATDQQSPLLVAAGRFSTGVWGTFGAVAVAGAIMMITFRLIRRGSTYRGVSSHSWALAAVAGVVVQIGLFLAYPVEPGFLEPLVPLVWLLIGLTLETVAPLVVVLAVALSSFVAPTASPVFGRTILEDAKQRRAGLDYAADVTRAVMQLPPGAVVVTGSMLPQLQASQPRSVLAAAELGGPNRSIEIPERVVLPGGQILTYRVTGIERAPVAYRLVLVKADLPILPVECKYSGFPCREPY